MLSRCSFHDLMRAMNIGKRLRVLREAKGLSQGDIERRSGLLRSYISRVEGGYTAPSLSTLEKFAKALNVEPYQLLFQKSGQPRSAALPNHPALSRSASRLLRLYEGMPASDRKLLVLVATKIAKS
jgi:transcriptional regulator with XRE-family HTH domain